MKQPQLLLSLLFTLLCSFSFPKNSEVPQRLPLCTALKKILSDEDKNYSSFKGEPIDANDDGSENFQLTIKLEGWESNQYVKEDEGGYVELYKTHLTKAKAAAHFKTVATQLESCLGVKAEPLSSEKIEKLYVFIKGKSEIALMQTSTEKETLVILTIEKGEN